MIEGQLGSGGPCPRRLGREFFLSDGVTLARSLVGKLLIRRFGEREAVCRLTETEAYMGPQDKASHAYGNRRSKRTGVFYREGGLLYIYLIYGMYHCCNVIAAGAGEPQAVLLRAAEPLSGLDLMGGTRRPGGVAAERLANGPGKLCRALAIDLSFYGYDLVRGSKLWIADDGRRVQVERSARVNIDYAEEYRELPWRFFIKDSRFLSRR
jgi:DNA-3-methyladenine glycosylase